MAAPSPRRRVGYHRLQQPTTASSSDGDGDGDPGVLWLVEDNALVLLGGEVWPSAFAMAEAVEVRMLQSSEPPPSMIVELGAGTAIPSVRHFSEAVLRRRGGALVRINPRECEVPAGPGREQRAVGLACGGLAGLEGIAAALG